MGRAAAEFVRWWWARREEIAGPSVGSSDCLRGGERGFSFGGNRDGLGGEELGVISRRAGEIWGGSKVVVESSKSTGVSSPSRYIGVSTSSLSGGFESKSECVSGLGLFSALAGPLRGGASFANWFFSSSESNDFSRGLGIHLSAASVCFSLRLGALAGFSGISTVFETVETLLGSLTGWTRYASNGRMSPKRMQSQSHSAVTAGTPQS